MQRSTNYTFYLPENSDYRDISVLNWNFNKIDSELAKTNSDIAIFASGNNAPRAISTGQYVIWGGNLYTASTSIASGTTLSTDNLTRVTIGGLNSLKSSVASDIQYLKGRAAMGDSIASEDALATALNTMFDSMANFSIANAQFLYTGTSNNFSNGVRYFAQINRGAGASSGSAFFVAAGTNQHIGGSKTSEGWTFKNYTKATATDTFYNAISIATNTDLNDLTTNGVYHCLNAATSATLINSPVTNAGFSMFNLKKGAYSTQIIFTGGLNFYTRTLTSTGWSAWRTFTGT